MNSNIKIDLAYIIADLYPNYMISEDQIPQGAKPPFFIVKQLSQNYNKLIGDISDSTIMFDISYYPEETRNIVRDIEGVQMTLLRAFSNNKRIRLTNVDSKTVDNILHITGTIKVREKLIDIATDKMDKLYKDIKEV